MMRMISSPRSSSRYISTGFDPSCANRMPASFFRSAVDAVRVDEAAFVLEHLRRQLK